MSTGRGGAGNIGKERRLSTTTPEDLKTPVIKSDTYTTGRGGTGNMAKNSDPSLARASQDVEAPPPREPEGPFHYGRGGAANIAKATDEEIRAAQKRSNELDRQPLVDDAKTWSDKGKGLLEKIAGKK